MNHPHPDDDIGILGAFGLLALVVAALVIEAITGRFAVAVLRVFGLLAMAGALGLDFDQLRFWLFCGGALVLFCLPKGD